jgi:hypothetical protein
MGASGGGEFIVSVRKREVVAAVLPLQEHRLPQSNLDLLLPTVDVGVFFCYKNPTNLTFESMAGALKKALAQVLVSHYAFAGEVVQNSVGEPELLCNNRGVDFVEAFAEVDLKDLNLYNPDDTVEGKLVPEKKHGIFAVQVCHICFMCMYAPQTQLSPSGFLFVCFGIPMFHKYKYPHVCFISDFLCVNIYSHVCLVYLCFTSNSHMFDVTHKHKYPPRLKSV